MSIDFFWGVLAGFVMSAIMRVLITRRQCVPAKPLAEKDPADWWKDT